jgi:Mg/Co/Ni transporter MgtE
VDYADVEGLDQVEQRQGVATLLAAFEHLKPADLAEVIQALPAKRRLEVATALDVDRLADLIEELGEDDRVEIVARLDEDRAAEVVEAMQPDDAADLLAELPEELSQQLLALMDPGEAEDMRRLLAYDEDTAGGLMTSEPVILAPDATVAEALAHVRRTELPVTLAAAAFVCRPPLETPTGRYLGLVHIQRMLREPPHTLLGAVLDKDVEPLDPTDDLETVTRHLATYDLVAVPVTDENRSLLGVVSADDVLDHLLPDDWRDRRGAPAAGGGGDG